MVYGYARCSTDEKKQDINRQRRELYAMGVDSDECIYWEYESGTKEDRPEFMKLLSVLAPGDTLVTTEVSRLTRSTKQLCNVLDIVREKKICLKIGSSFTADCRGAEIDPMTKGMILMWGVFSEMERDMISQRVKSGIENARSKGKQIGRPVLTKDNIPDKFWKYKAMYDTGAMNISEIAKVMECTRGTVYRYLKIAEGVEENGK